MKDRIVFFVLGSILATLAYFVGDVNNISAQNDKNVFDEIVVKGHLRVVDDKGNYSEIKPDSIVVYDNKSGDMTSIYHDSVWSDKLYVNSSECKSSKFGNIQVDNAILGTIFVNKGARINSKLFVEHELSDTKANSVAIIADKDGTSIVQYAPGDMKIESVPSNSSTWSVSNGATLLSLRGIDSGKSAIMIENSDSVKVIEAKSSDD